ncbi:MAG: carboxypeptidase regulatory-like domain-containing protein [Myxococcales bacterium]|nr:carboxypeptidase regulatory-like domain-containing protein [Myxococcales bacterium]
MHLTNRRLRLLLLVVLLSGCDGCGSTQEPSSEPTTIEEGESPTADSRFAVLEGVVRLAEGAEAPQYPENPMVPPTGRPEPPEACAPPQQTDRAPLQPAADRGLNGVLVALHDFSTIPEHEPVTHEMTITDCRLTPRLVVATRGDRLRLTNQTEYPFLPNFGMGVLQALVHGQSREVELGQGGARTLECGFAAPCGRAEIVTLYHPLHTVTDEAGHFRIENVPTGEEIRVSAWHPLLVEGSETITLRAGETRRVELTVTPAPQQAAPADTPPHDGPAENDPDILF